MLHMVMLNKTLVINFDLKVYSDCVSAFNILSFVMNSTTVLGLTLDGIHVGVIVLLCD